MPTARITDRELAERLPLHPRDFHILLSLLEGACHGYGLVKEIERRTEGAVQLDPANLYRAIQRLEQDGLVVEAEAPANAGEDNRKRRFYGITAIGSQTLVAEAERMRTLVDAVAAKQPLPSSGKS